MAGAAPIEASIPARGAANEGAGHIGEALLQVGHGLHLCGFGDTVLGGMCKDEEMLCVVNAPLPASTKIRSGSACCAMSRLHRIAAARQASLVTGTAKRPVVTSPTVTLYCSKITSSRSDL
ncbi:MAG: hypothetical protein R2856_21305 [Caldilineaceae bacterium]